MGEEEDVGRGPRFSTSPASLRSSMSFSTRMRVSLEVVGVLNGALQLRKKSGQQVVSSHLRITPKPTPPTSTLSRKSKFLRATPFGFTSPTLIPNKELMTPSSKIKMATFTNGQQDVML